MNQYFSITRFGRLLRKHTTEHLRTYLLGTAVLAGAIAVIVGGLTYVTRQVLSPDIQGALYSFGLQTAGVIFTASIFAELGQPREAAPLLLLPASHLEKYTMAWLYSLPVFLLVYTAVFAVVNTVAAQLGNHGQPYQLFNLLHDWSTARGPLLSYALLHSIALWCAIYFKKLHAIKTAFLVFGGGALLLIGNISLLKGLIGPDVQGGAPFGEAFVRFGHNHSQGTLASPITPWQLVLLPLVLAVLLWLASYARLTEKQL